MTYDREYFNNIAWRFVTRRFSTIYIHEEGYYYRGDQRENGKLILWEIKDRTSLGVEGIGNLKYGLPKPKLAGYTHDSTCYIYCDSLFLCPDCGRFYFSKDDDFSLNTYFHTNIASKSPEVQMQALISLYEEKKNNNEFEIVTCNHKICVSEKARNLKLKLSSNDRDTRVDGLTDAIDGYYSDKILNRSDNGSNKKEGYIYIIKAEKYIKIGVADNVKERLKQIQGSCPIKVDIINFWKISKLFYYENLLHKQYKKFRVHGEWFALPEEEINFLSSVSSIEEALKKV